jgi:outer membrane protein X
MKKIVFIWLAALLTISGHAQKGHSTIGAGIGYAVDGQSITLGIDYRRHIFQNIRIAPSLAYLIRNNDLSAWHMNVDGHYVVNITGMFSFYPIGGINLSIWDNKTVEGDYVRLGFNVGLGGEWTVTKEISLGLDMKYNVITTYDQAFITTRVAYHF